MQKKLSSVGSLFLLMVFFFGSIGLSFNTHSCTGSGTSESFFYPEITQGHSGCCCEEEAPVLPSDGCLPVSVAPPSCCTTIHVYLKGEFTGYPVHFQVKPFISAMSVPVLISADTEPGIQDQHKAFQLTDPSPPWFGRDLIYFIHQVRIPDPLS